MSDYIDEIAMAELRSLRAELARLRDLCREHCRWIPVGERLPEEKGRYLATIEVYSNLSRQYERASISIEYFDGKRWPSVERSDEDHPHRVTHWHPLPPEPEKSNAI